jgi:hypothetical protein
MWVAHRLGDSNNTKARMSRSTLTFCSFAAFVSLSGFAAAAAAEPAAPNATAPDDSKIHFAIQPPPRGDSRTYHRHDGFYLRTNLGIAPLWASLDDGGEQDFDVDVSGTAMAIDLLVGGTPTPGLTIGGGLLGNWAFGASYERDGVDVPDRDFQDGTLGVFVDGFPSDTGGWHLGGLVGLSGVNVQQDGFVERMGGLGGAVWGGYDRWVADDWSLGGQLRLTMNQTSGDENGYDVSAATWTLGLSFSALYH